MQRTLEDMVSAFGSECGYYRRAPSPVELQIEPPAPSAGSFIRLIIPDSHGEHCHWGFANGMILDVEKLAPDIREVVWLGDHLDCGGTFNAHQRNYTRELTESYRADVHAARRLIQMVRERTPLAAHHYLEGNHEEHVERFLARNFSSYQDAEYLLDLVGPRSVLRLDELDIRYYRSSEMHMGLAIPGLIKLGKVHFIHGVSVAKAATAVTLDQIGDNVVHGHTHRAQSTIIRTATSQAIGGWCPGTLAKLQPLYQHTRPTTWTGGYALEFVESSGLFSHMQVPLFGNNNSGLRPLLSALGF
jgi:UDP-2,3-diacylglucosamine pyrophosphatase LpxH